MTSHIAIAFVRSRYPIPIVILGQIVDFIFSLYYFLNFNFVSGRWKMSKTISTFKFFIGQPIVQHLSIQFRRILIRFVPPENRCINQYYLFRWWPTWWWQSSRPCLPGQWWSRVGLVPTIITVMIMTTTTTTTFTATRITTDTVLPRLLP